MNKVKYFRACSLFSLECDVEEFVRNKEVITASFCTEKHGYETEYYCLVIYKER